MLVYVALPIGRLLQSMDGLTDQNALTFYKKIQICPFEIRKSKWGVKSM